MKAGILVILLALAVIATARPGFAQAPRKDYIWARSTNGAPITLDGVLDEPAWAQAESISVRYGVDNGVPGSGYKAEGGIQPSDPTNCTIKFLTVGDSLYVAFVVRDSSIGGGPDFNRFDGILGQIMDHTSVSRPTPVIEHLYSWWSPDTSDHNPTGINHMPTFRGKWATNDGTPRTTAQIQAWNAAISVIGKTNSDTTLDQSYTVEMKYGLSSDGYDITGANGDVIEWSVSIYDNDWYWPLNVSKWSINRAWIQNPWGNVAWYDEMRVYAKPSVSITSGALPAIGPDLRIPNGAGYPDVVVDGLLSDAVWASAPHFDIHYGDDALRASYPGVGPYRSGQFQPTVNTAVATPVDRGDCTVKYFFKADTLYLGFDVRDKFVQYRPEFDRQDGLLVTINDKSLRGTDHNLLGRRLTFVVNTDGTALPLDYLPAMRDSGGAKVALHINSGTTVDTLGDNIDNGYTAELSIVLPKLSYPAGRGDGTLFLGINLLDGDSFGTQFKDSYGTRTWWFRQFEGEDGPVWAYMDPTLAVNAVGDPPRATPSRVALLGNAPNPFRAVTAIRYVLPRRARVTLEVFDLQGRIVARRDVGLQSPGEQSVPLHEPSLRNGLYLYRISAADPVTGKVDAAPTAKMMVIR